jgi:hypothetical protein
MMLFVLTLTLFGICCKYKHYMLYIDIVEKWIA